MSWSQAVRVEKIAERIYAERGRDHVNDGVRKWFESFGIDFRAGTEKGLSRGEKLL
jgi:hypothetical protein